MELLLEENPYRKRRRRNPWAFDNPKRRRRRNPLDNPALPVVGKWAQGIGAEDLLAAAGGLIATNWLPLQVVKTATTTQDKLLRLAVAIGAALGVGYLARNLGPSAGRAAIAGGLAGATVQALKSFTTLPIGEQLALPAGRGVSRIGDARVVSSPTNRGDEVINVIQP